MYPVNDILNYSYDVVIVTPTKCNDMKQQLLDLGVDEDKIILLVESYLESVNISIGLKCFGQHYDDLIIAALFGQLGIEHPSYMDLGANFPYAISNTALLYLNGSRGINIDANPNLIELFEHERPEDINLNLGVDSENGQLTFYRFDEHEGLSTFSREAAVYDTLKIP